MEIDVEYVELRIKVCKPLEIEFLFLANVKQIFHLTSFLHISFTTLRYKMSLISEITLSRKDSNFLITRAHWTGKHKWFTTVLVFRLVYDNVNTRVGVWILVLKICAQNIHLPVTLFLKIHIKHKNFL